MKTADGQPPLLSSQQGPLVALVDTSLPPTRQLANSRFSSQGMQMVRSSWALYSEEPLIAVTILKF